MQFFLLIVIACICGLSHAVDYQIKFQNGLLGKVDRRFLSIAVSAGNFNKTGDRFPIDFDSLKLRTLLRALRPSYVRVGGTRADFIKFVKNDHPSDNSVNTLSFRVKRRPVLYNKKEHKKKKQQLYDGMRRYDVSVKTFHKLYDFIEDCSSTLLWDINAFYRDPVTYEWDSRNFEILLRNLPGEKYNNILWQLGNEANRYKKFTNNPVLKFNGTGRYPVVEEVGRDYLKLRSILKKYGRGSDIIVGPEVTQPKGTGKVLDFVRTFMSVDGVHNSVDSITMHQYYADGKTTNLDELLDPVLLDTLKEKLTSMISVASGKPVWLTETGSAWGGGAPEISNRYAAGFLLLDKLGIAATTGIKVVIRQSFLAGKYAMVNTTGNDFIPFPDFYLSVLFKRLVGSEVLNVSIVSSTSGPDNKFRVYAHCSRKSSSKYSGYVTVYVLNLHDKAQAFSFDSEDAKIDQFILTPGESDNLQSDYVRLNGKILQMIGNNLPVMKGKETTQPISMPPLSFGFFVIKKD